ncbi:hypothetical protein acdb102_10450 [Acidothermaceae bacterium B102]|nr:hypothetical protein acdb102_10450 [Acidothermaceae bacterium B102]
MAGAARSHRGSLRIAVDRLRRRTAAGRGGLRVLGLLTGSLAYGLSVARPCDCSGPDALARHGDLCRTEFC